MPVKWPWQGFQIWSVQLNTCFLKEAVHEWSVVGCKWSLKEQTELRGTLKSGQRSNICSTSLLKIQRGLCLKRLLKADVLSVYQVILLPQSDVSSFSGGWSKKIPAERVWADSPTLPLGKTSHCNAGAIWGSLYKAVVNGRSLFHSPGRRAGPWGWLWWCAVA